MWIARLVIVMVIGVLAPACDDSSAPDVDAAPEVDAADVDAAPAPINGTWHLTRTVTSQPSSPPGCPTMSGSTDIVVLDVEHEPHVVLPEHPGFDPSFYGPMVTGDRARFTAEEFGLLAGEPTIPTLVGHDLLLDRGQLAGTAQSRGDGPDLGCTWLMSVVGTR